MDALHALLIGITIFIVFVILTAYFLKTAICTIGYSYKDNCNGVKKRVDPDMGMDEKKR